MDYFPVYVLNTIHYIFKYPLSYSFFMVFPSPSCEVQRFRSAHCLGGLRQRRLDRHLVAYSWPKRLEVQTFKPMWFSFKTEGLKW